MLNELRRPKLRRYEGDELNVFPMLELFLSFFTKKGDSGKINDPGTKVGLTQHSLNFKKPFLASASLRFKSYIHIDAGPAFQNYLLQ